MTNEGQESTKSGYSEAEMIRMQRDAIRRVREMQQRAREFEQARRASAQSVQTTEQVIPRPTLTGNPIGSGLGNRQSLQAHQINSEASAPQSSPGMTYSGDTQHTGHAYYARQGQLNGHSLGSKEPNSQDFSESSEHMRQQSHPEYHGARRVEAQAESKQSLGGIVGNLLGGQGISGIGSGISSIIGGFSEPVKGALSSLGLDNERLLIILVMFIVLTHDDYDNMLLLALGYLLL